MTDSPMRDALLRQEKPGLVDRELAQLRELEANVDRRARRLALATIAVWVSWVLVIALMFALPMLMAQEKPAAGAPAQPPVHAAPRAPAGLVARIASAAVLLVVLGGGFGLPVLGVVLLIMAVRSRRSATLSQIRTSLAAIDARLAQLAAAQARPEGTDAAEDAP